MQTVIENNQSQAIDEIVNNRFYNLIVGLSHAQEAAGVDVDGKVKAEHSEQFNARRALLRVEKLAKRDMELNKRSEQNFIDGIQTRVNDVVCERLIERLRDIDDLYFKLLNLHDSLPSLLDTLSVKAASIARLEPLVAEIGWLATDLLKLVNTPKYRKTDRLGKVVVVENLRMALSFLGIENLKMLIPAKVMRRAIPQITDPYPAFKTKIWEHTLGSALACQRIAMLSKVNPSNAFTLGMFHEFGKLIVAKLYFRIFEEVHREALEEAHNEVKREEYAALQKIGPTSDYLLGLMWEHSTQISARIIQHMQMKRVFIHGAMDEYAKKVPIKEMTPLARVLLQGQAYSKFTMLKRYKLINTEEAKGLLTTARISPAMMQALKGSDLTRLNLSMDEDE